MFANIQTPILDVREHPQCKNLFVVIAGGALPSRTYCRGIWWPNPALDHTLMMHGSVCMITPIFCDDMPKLYVSNPWLEDLAMSTLTS